MSKVFFNIKILLPFIYFHFQWSHHCIAASVANNFSQYFCSYLKTKLLHPTRVLEFFHVEPSEISEVMQRNDICLHLSTSLI